MTKVIIRKRPVKQRKIKVDREWFYQKYAVELVPTRSLAQEIGCVDNHISAIADMLCIPRRGRLPAAKTTPDKYLLDISEVASLYFDKKMPCNEIGAIMGCSGCAIRKRLKKHGYKLRHHNDTKRGSESPHKIKLDANLVVAMYLEKYASGKTVSDHFGVSRQVIDRILHEEGVPKKPITEARNMIGENHPLWRTDITPEEREKRRDITKQKAWSQDVYKRDNYTCQKCGDRKGGNLNAHHIIPHSADRSKAWDIDNGITLCKPCHYAFHNQYSYTKCTEEDLAFYLEDVKANAKPSKS